ncbi:hypothetical protein N7541_009474 [Penicillium brevicompactum]|uniref:Uncharacterized protein n=1 Tax=Penicillium brevicompactum TaxID=5074 RepID=A0A9W9QLV8_PENBR|nr:hypothetical protein N7541_009474 [Penicillium brevicompactum]
MADPPAGAPEATPTNTKETTNPFSLEEFQPSIVPRKRRQPRHGDEFTSAARAKPEFAGNGEPTGRVTTKEVRQLIDGLKDIIQRQRSLIQTTKDELQEVKRDRNVLLAQNEKPNEEIRALRAQIEAVSSTPPTRSWAANCVRISTQRSLVDPKGNNNNDEKTFGRYLPTNSADDHIRFALLNTVSTDAESAELARNNTEMLNEPGNNTKLVKPRVNVVVRRTPTEDFDLENANAQAIVKIMEENDLTGQGFRIEELNIMKSGPSMEAIFNDHQSQNLDVLLIQEPSITTYLRFCNLIYVNRRVSTSSHRQILCDHSDVAAVKIWKSDFQILSSSVYIPSVPLCADDDASAEPALNSEWNSRANSKQAAQTRNVYERAD